MRTKLSQAFDESLRRIRSGEPVKACLAEYPHLRRQLVSLLYSALSIGTVPRLSPSDEFRTRSKARLMARLQERSIKAKPAPAFNGLGALWKIFERAILGPAKVVVPLTLALFLVLQGFLIFSTIKSLSPTDTSALASQCVLTTFDGNIQLKRAGSDTWEKAENGMTLKAGSWVQTAADSRGLLTFFEGSTITLEPATIVEVRQVESTEAQSRTIVMKQWLGRTWSRVVKMADSGSRYEVETPSAVATVRGTQFVVEVDETGATTVQTMEGLVSVSAQGQEVYLPAGQQTRVEPGASPSAPVPVSPAESGGPPAQGQGQPSGKTVVPEAPAGSVPPGEATKPGADDEKLRQPGKEKSGTQSPDRKAAPGQGQGGLTGPGQGSAPDQISIEGGPYAGEPGQEDYIRWMLLGIILASFGTVLFMWRRM